MNINRILSMLCATTCASTIFAAPILYTDFSSTAGLTLNGAAAQAGNVLRVTPADFDQSGSVFSTSQITLGAGYTFSTFFVFQITESGGIGDEDGAGADGLAFIIQTNSNTAGGSGGGLGYEGLANSVAVEFDTFNNGTGFFNDPNGNHVGIAVGGGFNGPTAIVSNRINDGNVWYAWADYDGTTLEVRLSDSSLRPSAAIVTRAVDLAAELGSINAFVGFTSGTGSGIGNHDILRWEFRDSFDPITTVPTPDSWVLILLGGYALRRRLSSR
jgi:hypothetical protein